MAGTVEEVNPVQPLKFPSKPDAVSTEDALKNNFNLKEFDFGKDVSKETKRGYLVTLARTAEAAERYDDMCLCMRHLVVENGIKAKDDVTWLNPETDAKETEIKTCLSVDERNLLSVAYKNVIGARRASWRTLTAETKDENNGPLIDGYKKAVEKELKLICKNVLNLLQKYLILTEYKPKEKTNDTAGETNENQDGKAKDNTDAEGEAQVFYLKMAGDYFRYLSEAVSNKTNEKESAAFYKKAFDLSVQVLEPTHPIRLGLALNYSVCFYEILKDKKKACQLAKDAFDEAISKLDKLEEADYKDSTLIMQLLRDNLTLWTSSEVDDNSGQDNAGQDKNEDDDGGD